MGLAFGIAQELILDSLRGKRSNELVTELFMARQDTNSVRRVLVSAPCAVCTDQSLLGAYSLRGLSTHRCPCDPNSSK